MIWSYVPLASWLELYALPGFIETPVSPDLIKAGHAVQPYTMPHSEGERPCGIEGCAEGHLNGWLVLLPDGSKSNVGRICGRNVFGVAWSDQMRTARATRRAHTKQEALNRVREQARVAALEPIEAIGPAFDRARAMEASFYAFPKSIRESLLARTQDNDTALMDSRPPNPREIAEAKEKRKHPPDKVPFAAAHLRGLAALRLSGHVDGAMSIAKGKAAALAKLALSDVATADEISEALRQLRESRDKLVRVPDLWASFFDTDNIANLSYLSACRKLGFASARLRSNSPFEVLFL